MSIMTKIDIFSGFLGAGKTTLIKKLIKEAYSGEKLVLIENEFGQIGIDGGFMQDAGIEVREMNSGCICCSLVGDFGKALEKVLTEYKPDRILIEPSGVGKLSDFIRAVQNVAPHGAVLNGFTTVVDVNKCKMYMKNFGEFNDNQIQHASTIVLSRTQNLSEEKLRACLELLRQKNAKAMIVKPPWDQISGKQILDAMDKARTLQTELEALEEEACCGHHHHHDHDDDCGCGHHHHAHDHEDECGHSHDHDHEDACGHHHHEHGDDACSHNHTHEHHEEHHTHSHVYEEHEHTHEHSHEGHTHAHGHSHHHTSMKDIEHIIGHLNVPEKVKEDAIAVYKLIADAESHAHGRPVEEVHFHEVGAMDAVADIVGVCLAIYKLAPEQIIASPVHVGYGQIHCAHGILPIPAPATAHILQGIPIYGGRIEGELCTPTGAALLKHFAQSFGQMPMMAVEQTGYGMGMKDFTDANCLRAIIGNTVEGQEQTGCHGAVQEMDSIIELCCNLDDMTPEKIGFVTELLMEEGAFDVYTTNIQMKKNRPAVMLTCMCAKEDREKFLTLILKHTTTLGVREYTCKRYGLKREIREVETIYGTVRVKAASGYGVAKEKPEYEDMARIAKEKKISLAEIEKEVYKNLK